MPSAMVLKDRKCPKCNGWLVTERIRIEGKLLIGGAKCYRCGYFERITPQDYRIFCENNCVYWKWGADAVNNVDNTVEEY